VNETGLDLVRNVAAMNRGVYLEELVESTPTDFCIGVAAYPEKHAKASRPHVPGLKILTRREQLNVVPKHFGATIPIRLVERIEASPPELVVDAGIDWAVMQNTRPFVAMMERLGREA
jgi:methylenetetrahydrofolate reductase (NADPH)